MRVCVCVGVRALECVCRYQEEARGVTLHFIVVETLHQVDWEQHSNSAAFAIVQII